MLPASTEPTLPQGLALPSPSTRSLRIDDSKLSEPFQLFPTIAWPWRDAWLVPNSRSSTFHFRRVRRVILWYCHDGPDESVWERYICRWGLLGLRWDLRELESVGTHGLTTFPWRSLISDEYRARWLLARSDVFGELFSSQLVWDSHHKQIRTVLPTLFSSPRDVFVLNDAHRLALVCGHCGSTILDVGTLQGIVVAALQNFAHTMLVTPSPARSRIPHDLLGGGMPCLPPYIRIHEPPRRSFKAFT